jgi:hypothetical protein
MKWEEWKLKLPYLQEARKEEVLLGHKIQCMVLS